MLVSRTHIRATYKTTKSPTTRTPTRLFIPSQRNVDLTSILDIAYMTTTVRKNGNDRKVALGQESGFLCLFCASLHVSLFPIF
jgi:hypothetical protein